MQKAISTNMMTKVHQQAGEVILRFLAWSLIHWSLNFPHCSPETMSKTWRKSPRGLPFKISSLVVRRYCLPRNASDTPNLVVSLHIIFHSPFNAWPIITSQYVQSHPPFACTQIPTSPNESTDNSHLDTETEDDDSMPTDSACRPYIRHSRCTIY